MVAPVPPRPSLDDPGWGEYNGILWHDDGWVWPRSSDWPLRATHVELWCKWGNWWTLKFSGTWCMDVHMKPEEFIEHVMKPNGWEVGQ
jgi:hypothetical protein